MTNMTDTITKVREHYGAMGLTDRIKSALAPIASENQTLTVAQLAPLDQFHTRGILATAELAAAGHEIAVRLRQREKALPKCIFRNETRANRIEVP